MSRACPPLVERDGDKVVVVAGTIFLMIPPLS